MTQHQRSNQIPPADDPSNQWLYATINTIVALRALMAATEDADTHKQMAGEHKQLQHELVKRILEEFTPFVENSPRCQASWQMREIREDYNRHRAILGYSSPVVTFILSGMSYVLARLPSLKLDINQPIIRLLWRIFRWGLIDEYNQFHRRRQGPSPPEENLTEGSPDAQAWISRWAQLTHSGARYFDDDSGIDWESIADADPTGDPERVVDHIHARMCWNEALRFLHQQREVDRFIFLQRAYHKLPFKQIAAQLGEGHTDGAVRMQYHRLKDALISMLLNRGLIGEGEDSWSEGGRS